MRDATAKWKEVVLKAKDLEPDLPEVQAQIAAIAYYVDWDWPAAEREFRRAIDRNAADPDTHMWYADYLVNVHGRFDEGIAEARRAVELDPHNALYQVRLGVTLLDSHREDEAIGVFHRAMKADPDLRVAQINLVNAFAVKQMYKEALVLMASNSANNPAIVETQQRAYGGIAAAYGRAGEIGLALDYLERAYEEHEAMMVSLKGGRAWHALRGEPRFETMLRRMKLLN